MSVAERIAAYVEDTGGDVTAEQVNESLGIGNGRIYLNRLVKSGRIARVGRGRYAALDVGTTMQVGKLADEALKPRLRVPKTGVSKPVSNDVSLQVRASIKPRHHADEFPALGPATARSLSDTLQKVARKLETYLDGEEPYRVDAKGAYSPNPAYTILLGYLAEVRQLMVAVHKMGIAERETAVLEFDALSGFPEFVAWLLEALKPHPEALRDVLVAMSDKGWAGGAE